MTKPNIIGISQFQSTIVMAPEIKDNAEIIIILSINIPNSLIVFSILLIFSGGAGIRTLVLPPQNKKLIHAYWGCRLTVFPPSYFVKTGKTVLKELM